MSARVARCGVRGSDPLANSFVAPLTADMADDKRLSVEDYERSPSDDEEYGIDHLKLHEDAGQKVPPPPSPPPGLSPQVILLAHSGPRLCACPVMTCQKRAERLSGRASCAAPISRRSRQYPRAC